MQPPFELRLYLEHLRDVLAVVVDVAAEAFVASQRQLGSGVLRRQRAIAVYARFVALFILALGSVEFLIYGAVHMRSLLAEVHEFEEGREAAGRLLPILVLLLILFLEELVLNVLVVFFEALQVRVQLPLVHRWQQDGLAKPAELVLVELCEAVQEGTEARYLWFHILCRVEQL